MKLITANLLNRLWQNGIKPIKDAVETIKINYIKGISVNGRTITYTKGNGTTGTVTTQDTVYTHPTTAGYKHIPSGGSSGQILKWSASGTATWAAETNTWRGIQNNLTSTSTTDSLSAAQGKALNDKISELNTNLANQKNALNNAIGGYRAFAGNIAPGAFSGGVINFTEKFSELPAVVATIDHYYTDCLNVFDKGIMRSEKKSKFPMYHDLLTRGPHL